MKVDHNIRKTLILLYAANIDSNDYYFGRAICNEALGLYDKAAEDYHCLIDNKEYKHWAILPFNNKKIAEFTLRNALKSDSTDAIDYMDAAAFYIETGEIRKAKKMMKIASSMDKFDKCTINMMSYAFKGTALEKYFGELFPSE